MFITISQFSDSPIYQQIQDQLIQQILSGTLAGGTKLPSIRLLAQELHVSVITVKKAYEELERAGYIHTQAALGSFVCKQNAEDRVEQKTQRIESLLAPAVDEALLLHIPEEHVQAALHTLFSNRKHNHDDND